ncbi:TPA: DUF4222 domain-containing protein [Escherichia coli]|uniref:DUF4222 domain-containing protein n=1 Tax=Escherichia TaxID=561 RepID=UPI000A186853|nr:MULTISPECIES: DUF4222 domain-containing protein [Escherichia]EFC0651840.1 DUF4222 domain-containing protein [Escherichia coli]EFC0652596.1 DUF4222 domain-containing protein [Escherichia coli]MXE71493.1 DUF4222 domain-containing protein [Escherichia coli]OSM05506.1 putative bacteriophage protein [Escherichia marmotae]
MKKKNSGFTASGLSRPEIRLGDIYRDTRHGGRVVIRHVTPGNITYRRDFTLVDHYKAVNQKRAASYIRKIREMLVAGGKK